MKIEKISTWSGCDPLLTEAINAFSERWGSHSIESRKYSIFSLIRELIDQPWNDLQVRYPEFKIAHMDLAWSKYQRELQGDPTFANDERENHTLAAERLKAAFLPCPEKIDGKYVLSAFARHHGFTALDRFLQLTCRCIGPNCDDVLSASFDSLRELALACRSKKSKKKKLGKINARRTHLRTICRLCGRQTELSLQVEGKPWPLVDGDGRLRLSAMYCDVHKPKAPFSDAVRRDYLRAKRRQSKFDLEYSRLDRQGWGDSSVPRAKSGNQLVDEYIRRFVARRLQSFSFDVARYLLDQTYSSFLDQKLREEARMLVDLKITDRKKEMMMLLASGFNQTETGLRLGIKRQAVCKVLPTIDKDYRLDLC